MGAFNRLVQPYCHGRTATGQETLAGQSRSGGQSRSAMIASGKLWTVAKMTNVSVFAKVIRIRTILTTIRRTARFESIHCRI